ncbi:MAG: 4-(cytidine 5'-diphospho)-2-C-methyl-D-erythritol kinase [Parvibaculum sp.]|uniref:4-(cytidine 5'-diphospho)-2-C-methyl-D-erythritol kinase n=1 Tax=Parvibaculum sp. TaxID=2024848 RepID=UPI0032F032FE
MRGGVAEPAHAKINLSLRVPGRRGDGYHELQSLVVFAGICDRLTAEASDELTLGLTGPFGDILAGEADNLVLRAARALRDAAGVTAGAKLTLEKNLPVASGIGGGSADAAAALRALMRLWDVALEEEALAALAVSLGADVPVCLDTAPALMTGRGERIVRLPALPPFWLVLANPGRALSTASVFRELAAPPLDSEPEEGALPAFATLDGLAAWLRGQENDLEAPAIRLVPEIGEAIAALAATVECRLARMSGSGATCFGLYPCEAEARAAERILAAAHPDWWIEASPAIGVSGSG